jgi:hypothetical protein
MKYTCTRSEDGGLLYNLGNDDTTYFSAKKKKWMALLYYSLAITMKDSI